TGPPPEQRLIHMYPNVEEITVDYSGSPNAHFFFKLLIENTHVRKLSLMQITEQALGLFKRIPLHQLRSLEIYMNGDVLISIDILDQFENLEHLDLQTSEFIIRNPNQTKVYPKLKTLDLISSYVTREAKTPDIKILSRLLPNLKTLDYRPGVLHRRNEYKTLYAECFESFPLPAPESLSLSSLSLSPSPPPPQRLPALPFGGQLTELALSYLTQSYAKVIEKYFPNLERLDFLTDANMDSEIHNAIKYLLTRANFPRLKKFTLIEGVFNNYNNFNIESIFSRNRSIPISGSNCIQTKLKSITLLNLSDSMLTSNFLFVIGQFPRLEKLRLLLYKSDSIKRVAANTRCKSLLMLELATVDQVEISVIMPSLAKIFPNLRVLKLRPPAAKFPTNFKTRFPKIKFILEAD
ncbi:hypothetical protein H4219_006348, partial [Mycoemilia scoparia]